MLKSIKKRIPYFIKKNVANYSKNKIIKNYFQTKYKKIALLSYIVIPFKKNSLSHTSYFEAQSWAKILFELGYNVDIIHYENSKNIDLSKYDFICGFGDIFQQYFESGLSKKVVTIYYGTGMHVCHQNYATLKRIKELHARKNVWIGKSARFVEKTWTHQTTLSDGIIALGNNVSANSYQQYYDKKIYSVGAPFFRTCNADIILHNRKNEANKSFLWFGSSGLVHKGLDLVLENFSNRKYLTLNVCGPIENEKDFVEIYKKELYFSDNIKTHGFVDLGSEKFKDILSSCSFVIFPSCSEGGGAAVITAIGNGGLIPIISEETTVSTGSEIWIEELTIDGVGKAINSALSLSEQQIKDMQIKNLKYILENHSKEKYYNTLKNSIESIIKETNDL